MALHVHLDLEGGVAGDMFIAALLDARPDLHDGLIAELAALGAPAGVEFALRPHRDALFCGKRFTVSEPAAPIAGTAFAALRRRLRASAVAEPVKARAIAIFTALAEAEARVHGVGLDEVTFHEVGAWDSVADVVGAAYLIERLGAASWSCGPIPQGAGAVESAHGRLPLPAPAAAALLEGFLLVDDGLEGERVTPTGAAILRHLAPSQQADAAPRRLLAGGVGFGTRALVGRSNVLRALLYEMPAAAPVADRVAVIEFEIDDQSAEELAQALDRLRAAEGVLDVVQWPVTGKKGRLGVHVQLLARPGRLDPVIDLCFAETTTIGLRWGLADRALLPRQTVIVDGAGGDVRVKLVERPGHARTAKAEIDDLGGLEGGYRARRRARCRAEERARDDDE